MAKLRAYIFTYATKRSDVISFMENHRCQARRRMELFMTQKTIMTIASWTYSYTSCYDGTGLEAKTMPVRYTDTEH